MWVVKNITCGVARPTWHSYFILNHKCSNHVYLTTYEYAAMAAVSYLLFIVTYRFYNKVRVLNYSIHINAISNYWWSNYFLFLAIRSTILSAQYNKNLNTNSYYLANWIIGGIEVLLLCYALTFQQRFRSLNLINQEIDEEIIGQEMDNGGLIHSFLGSLRACKSGGLILLAEFILLVASLVIFVKGNDFWYENGITITHIAFWCYTGLVILLHLTSVVISFVISLQHSYDGPYARTKVCLILAVLVNSFESIPMFIWIDCAGITCYGNVMTLFDVFVISKFLSVLFVYLALHFEYHRLKNECQYMILTEVPGRTYQFPNYVSTEVST